VPFLESALDEITHLSQGVPRVINLLCDTCLQLGFLSQKLQIGTDIVEKAGATLHISPPQSRAQSSPVSVRRQPEWKL
jgi:hypothetical protein